jgi:hypothetical protein
LDKNQKNEKVVAQFYKLFFIELVAAPGVAQQTPKAF